LCRQRIQLKGCYVWEQPSTQPVKKLERGGEFCHASQFDKIISVGPIVLIARGGGLG
jgi:hypothetical protein